MVSKKVASYTSQTKLLTKKKKENKRVCYNGFTTTKQNNIQDSRTMHSSIHQKVIKKTTMVIFLLLSQVCLHFFSLFVSRIFSFCCVLFATLLSIFATKSLNQPPKSISIVKLSINSSHHCMSLCLLWGMLFKNTKLKNQKQNKNIPIIHDFKSE